MYIRECSVFSLKAPLVTPFRIATGQHDTLDNLLFKVVLDNGICGVGEAAVATHITGETISATANNLKKTGSFLLGKNAADYFSLLHGARERLAGNHAALAAVEMAVLDAMTRSMRCPFWALFGKKPRSLQTDITIVIGSTDQSRASARTWFKQGFRTFKVKIGKDKALDEQRVLAVHQAAPRAGILLDANQAFTAKEMLRFLKVVRSHGVHPLLLEQPVPKDDTEGLAQLTRSAGVPVCADESARSLQDVVRLLNRKAVNAINVKLMKSGILEAAEIARVARAAGAHLMIGAMMESSLAITAAAHMAAGLGCFDFVDLDTTFFVKGPLSRSSGLDSRGRFDLKDCAAGIGVQPEPLSPCLSDTRNLG